MVGECSMPRVSTSSYPGIRVEVVVRHACSHAALAVLAVSTLHAIWLDMVILW